MEESSEKRNKRTASADPLKTYLESTQEFFDMWLNSYQSTFGKFTQIPAFGPIREKQEKMMKGFPIYVNLYNTWVESNINFQTVFTEAMRKTYEKMVTETKGEITTEKYKDFYKMWLETYSETLKEFMKSGHFTSDMGRLMTNFMEYQKYNKEMFEENILKPGNFPTKSEIDEINKDLYALRKTLKGLDKKNNEISKELNQLKLISTKMIDEHEQKIENEKESISNLDNKNNEISAELNQLKLISTKRIDDIGLELDKKITQLDLDKKIAEISKKTKIDVQLYTDNKIIEASKKTKAETQTNLDKKIAEISEELKIGNKKIDEISKELNQLKLISTKKIDEQQNQSSTQDSR